MLTACVVVNLILLMLNVIPVNLVFSTFPSVKVNNTIGLGSKRTAILISYEIGCNLWFFKACNCDGYGSNGNTLGSNGKFACDDNGLCSCKPNIGKDKCDACASGLFPFPTCNKGKQLYSAKPKKAVFIAKNFSLLIKWRKL